MFTLNLNTSSSIFQSTLNAVSVGTNWLFKLHSATLSLLSKAGTASKTSLLFVRNFAKWNPPYLPACHQRKSFDVMSLRLCFHKLLCKQKIFSSGHNYYTQVMTLHKKPAHSFHNLQLDFRIFLLLTIKTCGIHVLLKLALGRT